MNIKMIITRNNSNLVEATQNRFGFWKYRMFDKRDNKLIAGFGTKGIPYKGTLVDLSAL